ncbi:MAG TPA: hypothetical protein VN048_06505 [Verrucomicrobiae bacterium]|jgi:hypothetical protein|nr:hypothetical protein [Verrucomicrobiae bacterium]
MKFAIARVSLFVLLLALVGAPRANANNAGAVVLVNSQSAAYLDYVHFLQPYLGNFGVPYAVLDIASNTVSSNLTNYALIIIGHAQLDTNHVYLSAGAQSNIAWAVSNGTGLVSFDNVLSSNNAPMYQFEQSIFGLGYTNPVTGGSVVFPPTEPSSLMHYITSLHVPNESLRLSNAYNTEVMTVAGLTLPSNATAVATCGGAPFVVISQYGQGRAVQWTSYDWMSSTIQGPVNGLDDLVWRGFVWAARKPFVMRGLPHLATMRVDDVSGDNATGTNVPIPFWWVHSLTNAGFKPFLALFIDDITSAAQNNPGDGRLTDLSNMVSSGSVTASIHSFSANLTNFFYFNHATETQWSDSVMSNNYVRANQFFQTAGFSSSKVVVAHYSEVGTNAFNGLTNLGVQFFLLNVVPGTVEYNNYPGAPWLPGAPYRLYETPQPAYLNMPMAYADWLAVPNHPELNGKFFNCYTEIRNVDAAGEWAPTNGDIPGSIARGVAMMKRGFDSMTLGNIFTHEFYIDPTDGPAYGDMTTNNWTSILQGITNGLASYNPIYVTLDYGCQYVRATRTSQITSGDYDPVTGRISAAFSGNTDLPITAYYYTGANSSITSTAATVPVFGGSTNVTLGSFSVPVQISIPLQQNGKIVFTVTGPYGARYSIDGSTNSGTWLPLQTVTLSNGTAQVSEPITATHQLFRARLLP